MDCLQWSIFYSDQIEMEEIIDGSAWLILLYFGQIEQVDSFQWSASYSGQIEQEIIDRDA